MVKTHDDDEGRGTSRLRPEQRPRVSLLHRPSRLRASGFSGAAAALRFEPFRPYLLAVTYGLLAGGFYLTYRPAPECAPGAACEMPGASRTVKALLWLSAVAVMVVTAFPWYSIYLF